MAERERRERERVRIMREREELDHLQRERERLEIERQKLERERMERERLERERIRIEQVSAFNTPRSLFFFRGQSIWNSWFVQKKKKVFHDANNSVPSLILFPASGTAN